MNHKKKLTPQAMVISENSIRFYFGSAVHNETFPAIQEFCGIVEKEMGHLIEEIVPSYETVTIFYRNKLASPQTMIEKVMEKWKAKSSSELKLEQRHIHIPVCYDEEFSEDIIRIAEFTGLTRDKVISLHTSTLYTVYALGFLPGFPYLGELPASLHVPRLEKPRLRVPKGTVGIGGGQTGIYPIESPGGWNILGRTPLDLYNPVRRNPFLLQVGDLLSFTPISVQQFEKIKKQHATNPDSPWDL